MANADTQNLTPDQTTVVGSEGWQADLADDVFGPVYEGGALALEPHNEEERQVIDPGVDGVEEIEAKFCAEWERDEVRNDGADRRNSPSWVLLAERCVVHRRHEDIEQGKGRRQTEEEEGEEEQHRPKVSAWHFHDLLYGQIRFQHD